MVSVLWLVKIRADFGSAQNIQLFHGLFAKTELLALAGVDLSSSSVKKETEVELGRPLQFCVTFALCPSELTAVEQFLHLFIGNCFFTVSYGLY